MARRSLVLGWISLSFFLAAQARAATPCDGPEIDLSRSWTDPAGKTHPGSMQHVKVKNQGSLPICYAEVAAVMVDAYRFSHKPPEGDGSYHHYSSPLVAAVGAFVEAHSTTSFWNQGSNPLNSVNYMRAHGSCEEFQTFPDGSELSALYQHLRGSYEAYQGYRQLVRSTGEVSDSKLARDSETLRHDRARDVYCYLRRNWWSVELSPTLPVIERALDEPTGNEFFQELFEKRACPGHSLALHIPEPTWVGAPTPQMQTAIDTQLAQPNAQPVAISYCASVLSSRRGAAPIAYGSASCGAHASLVMGRRKQGGRCQYLVQNSWGPDCSQYGSSSWQCRSGRIWVDADALVPTLAGAYWIPNQGQPADPPDGVH